MGEIVVGIDGSPGAQDALRWAAGEAELHELHLRVVMAFEYEPASATLPPIRSVPDYSEVERNARAALADAVAAAVPPAVPRREEVTEGTPADVILEAAGDAALIVVGSRGLGGFEGLLLGSVSRQVSSRARVPVAVIPPGAGRRTTGRLVVGIDGSDEAASALRWASLEAARRRARLEVIQVHDVPPVAGPPGMVIPPGTDEEIVERAREGAQRMVDQVLGPEPPVPVEVRGSIGHATRRLLDAAVDADLLVVGNRGRGRITAALLGSTSAGCVTHAPCPTVVVPRQ